MVPNDCGVSESVNYDGTRIYYLNEEPLVGLTPDQAANVDAALAASKSASLCNRRKVAAIGIANDGTPTAVGHNGIINGETCERCTLSRDQVAPGADYTAPGQRCPALHAEEVVALLCGAHVTSVLVIVTEQPCDRCADFMDRLATPWWVQEVAV